MKLLELYPQIFKFNNCKEFMIEFNIGEQDLIFTNRFLYKTFFKALESKCDYILQEDYNLKEPCDEIINEIIKNTASKNYKRVIAVGGGSIIDISKILALKNVSSVQNLFEKKIPIIREKELIIVPTTCGTGSEVTNVSITEIKEKGTKMGLAVPELFADYAILIPELVEGLPYEFFVYSSIDALIHAIEAYVSPNANCYTELFSIQAIRMIVNGYKEIIKKGKEYRKEIIEQFLIASNYAGIAFGNAGVGAVHALSYPLGGKYHVPHGEANYQFFIKVFDFYNRKNPEGKIKELNFVLADILQVPSKRVYSELEEILSNLIKRKNLRQYGMKEEEVYSFADSVINTQQRLLNNNYVQMTKEDMVYIYKNLL